MTAVRCALSLTWVNCNSTPWEALAHSAACWERLLSWTRERISCWLKASALSLWNLSLCLGLLLMHSLPLCPWGGTTGPLCSVWTEWAPQERVCQIVLHASLRQRAVVLNVQRVNHSCSDDTEIDFLTTFTGERTFYKRQKQPERHTYTLSLTLILTQPYQPVNILHSPEQIRSGCVCLARS